MDFVPTTTLGRGSTVALKMEETKSTDVCLSLILRPGVRAPHQLKRQRSVNCNDGEHKDTRDRSHAPERSTKNKEPRTKGSSQRALDGGSCRPIPQETPGFPRRRIKHSKAGASQCQLKQPKEKQGQSSGVRSFWALRVDKLAEPFLKMQTLHHSCPIKLILKQITSLETLLGNTGYVSPFDLQALLASSLL